jgi:hypothetical protein
MLQMYEIIFWCEGDNPHTVPTRLTAIVRVGELEHRGVLLLHGGEEGCLIEVHL